MPVISIYNNKGGVGKSTLTVGIAEFLAANLKKSVLVIDMDAQASSSGALLDQGVVSQAVESDRTVARLIGAARTGRLRGGVASFVTPRPAAETRGTGLGKLDIIVPNKPEMIELEEEMTRSADVLAVRDAVRPALGGYDYVLIDLPGNIDRRSKLSVAALLMSDFVLIPVEPTHMALNGLPDTFDLIDHARALGRNGRPAIAGLVLNKTDRRAEQYRSQFMPMLEASNRGELPPVFDNVIPDTPKLATATDGTHEFTTLKDRFDTYYDHVRKVARELDERCRAVPPAPETAPAEYAGWVRGMFAAFTSRKKKKSKTDRKATRV